MFLGWTKRLEAVWDPLPGTGWNTRSATLCDQKGVAVHPYSAGPDRTPSGVEVEDGLRTVPSTKFQYIGLPIHFPGTLTESERCMIDTLK